MNKKKILIVEDEFIIADILDEILKSAGYLVCGIADSVKEAVEMMAEFLPDFVLLDIYLKGKQTGLDLARQLTAQDLPFLFISANFNQKILDVAKTTHPYGFVIKPFRDKDVLTALDIAFYRYENQRDTNARQTALLQKKAAGILTSPLSWENKLLELAKSLQSHFPFELLSFGLKQEEQKPFFEVAFFRTAFDEYQLIGANELMMVTKRKLNELVRLKSNDNTGEIATWYDDKELTTSLKTPSLKKLYAETYGLRSHLTIPVEIGEGEYAYLNFYSRRPEAYHADHLLLVNKLQPVINNVILKMLQQPSSPLTVASTNFTLKHRALVHEQPNPFQDIIGKSHLLLTVFDHVVQVAKADSSVLILGESGTGKEKIAERIHFLSLRNDKPFIRINCAALPNSLIDSELFGHEKGAFTGAFDRKIGKFEQAHNGSIFLDEIGELPLESQSKLLRVLQEKEIERIGGRSTIKTDVRIIAATNRDLSKEVAEGRFRLDLFYRINVFPIVMPPLRERKEDIPDLANHFLGVYASKIGKNIRGISPQVVENMKHYNWPGNIRELENLIERNVLLTRDDMINSMVLPTQSGESTEAIKAEPIATTMSEGERAHILAALKKCNGKIWGEGGAASLLDLPPTTLNSKMKKLGIRKGFGN